jgi:hypothetical protein
MRVIDHGFSYRRPINRFGILDVSISWPSVFLSFFMSIHTFWISEKLYRCYKAFGHKCRVMPSTNLRRIAHQCTNFKKTFTFHRQLGAGRTVHAGNTSGRLSRTPSQRHEKLRGQRGSDAPKPPFPFFPWHRAAFHCKLTSAGGIIFMTLGNKVFVSSTCYDLIDLRADVQHGLRDMGLAPVLSDDSTSDFEVAPDKNSIETCLVNVDACDHVIFVLSQRYGPKLQQYEHPELSATHAEYRRAVEKGKLIYFYVRDRLLAEYQLWKKNPTLQNKYPWSKKDAELLFKFIKEHGTPPDKGSTRNNWIKTFRSSTDLIDQIRKDLSAPSGEALLQSLAETGQLPEFEITKATAERHCGQGERDKSTMTILYEQMGTATVSDLQVKALQPSDSNKPIIIDGSVRPTGRHPPDIRGHQFSASFLNLRLDHNAPLAVIRFEYTIARGWRIAQVFYLSIGPPYINTPPESINGLPLIAENKGKLLLSANPVICQEPENPWNSVGSTTNAM